MTSPTIRLEEQLTDLRSDQIAYKLIVENQNASPIRLIAVDPRIPAGVNLLEISDTSLAEANARKAALLDELNKLLDVILWATSSTFRETWIERQKEAIKELFSVFGFLQFYFQLSLNRKNLLKRLRQNFDTFGFKMTSPSDAASARERWIQGLTDHETIKALFEAKVEQLNRVYEGMDEGNRHSLTTIEAGSLFTATYVLKFDRKLFEPSKYHLAFSVTYMSQDTPSPLVNSVATNVQISPYPWSLSIVAIAASLLGVLLRISLSNAPNPLREIVQSAQTGQLLVAPIVALIFFNVYEYTSLGKDLRIPVSWRSALLIGALCGIAQDRILAALKALIGA